MTVICSRAQRSENNRLSSELMRIVIVESGSLPTAVTAQPERFPVVSFLASADAFRSLEMRDSSISSASLRRNYNVINKANPGLKRKSQTQERCGARGVVSPVRQKSGITYTRLFSPAALAHQGRKGAALTIPLLPPRARERGAEKLPHTPKRRLFQEVQRQVCASPGAPFDATSRDEPVRRHLT